MTSAATTTRTWTCLCGSQQSQVVGDPALTVFCYCMQCRRFAGTPMQLALFSTDQFTHLKGNESLIKYKSSAGAVRNSCKKCGAFVYKEIGDDKRVVPLGCLEGDAHIFVAHRGSQDIPFPELPQYDEWP